MNDIDLKQHISSIKNFPKEGIIFRDLMPLLETPDLLQKTIKTLCEYSNKIVKYDTIIGIESRGFLLGMPMAFELGKSFVAARKKGKLPGDVIAETYDLEYGHSTVEIQRERISPHKRYLIVDDLLATGGTASAVGRLIQKQGGHIAGFVFLIELKDLPGRLCITKEFPDVPCESVIHFQDLAVDAYP